MTNKKFLIMVLLVLGAGMLFKTTSSVFAYRGDPTAQGPNCTQERHEAMIKAFENNDYNAWKNLRQGNGRITQVINEGNFARFAEMRRLMLDGKTEEANQIRAELGLGLGNGSGNAQEKGYGRNSR